MAEVRIDLRAREVRRQLAGLRRLASELLSDPGEAEDLVHEALASAAGRTVREPGRLRAYLTAVLRRRYALRVRSDIRRRRRERAAAGRMPVIDAHEAAASAEEAQLLASVVAELGDADKLVLVRHFYQGLTTAQIAEQDGITDRAVRYRIERALASVRSRLQQRDPRGWAGVCAAIAIPLPAKAAAGALASKIVITCLVLGLATIGIVTLRSESPTPVDPTTGGAEPTRVAEVPGPTTPPDPAPDAPAPSTTSQTPVAPTEPPASNTLAIRGTVRMENGTRVPGIFVEAKAADDSIRFVRTDGDGTFELTGLAPGTYRVRATARPAIRLGPHSRYAFADDARVQPVHDVAAGDRIDLTINGRHRLDLRLVDRAARPLDIIVSPLLVDVVKTSVALRSEGGRATVFTNSPAPVRFGFGITSITEGNYLPPARRILTPDGAPETFVFAPGRVVRGTIRREDGEPVGDLTIRVLHQGARHKSRFLRGGETTIDYELAGIGVETIVLRVQADSLPEYHTRPIVLPEDGVMRQDIVLRRGGRARIRVDGFDPKRERAIAVSFESLTTGDVFENITDRPWRPREPQSNRSYLLLPDDYRVIVRQGDDYRGEGRIKVVADEEHEARIAVAPTPK